MHLFPDLISFKEAKAQLRPFGMSITKNDDEYRVDFLPGHLGRTRKSAYFTDDLQDAINTGVYIAQHFQNSRHFQDSLTGAV